MTWRALKIILGWVIFVTVAILLLRNSWDTITRFMGAAEKVEKQLEQRKQAIER